jgi:hypothetical protein
MNLTQKGCNGLFDVVTFYSLSTISCEEQQSQDISNQSKATIFVSEAHQGTFIKLFLRSGVFFCVGK